MFVRDSVGVEENEVGREEENENFHQLFPSFPFRKLFRVKYFSLP